MKRGTAESVSIAATETEGTSPLNVGLTASATGSSCGCCGGRDDAEIVEFRWDLNGDSITDTLGPAASLTLTASGSHVIVVTVIDSANETAAARTALKSPGAVLLPHEFAARV